MNSEYWEFSKFFIPLAGAVLAWFLNERKKRAWEEYERKESNYKDLIISLKGFYMSGNQDERKEQKLKFIDQLNLCWLYSPDEVIEAGYNFIRCVHTENEGKASDDEKQRALGSFILAIRNDLLSRHITRKSKLTPRDFMLLTTS